MSNCCKDTKKCCGIGFHSIPAALGDDTGEFKPENGAYHNMLVKYEENGALYFYANDGSWVKIEEPVNDDTSTYTITASNLQWTNTFATRNWSSDNADTDFDIVGYGTSSVAITRDGSSVSAADLIDAGDSLLKAIFSFDVVVTSSIGGGEPTEITMHVSATPTSVVSNDGILKISGVYCLDETPWTEEPGSIAEPPLRFSLGIAADNIWFQFETFEVTM